MSIQKFAWIPMRVWDIRTRDYGYIIVWLSWYWVEEGKEKEPDKPSNYHFLSDDINEDTRLWYRNKCKTNTNRW